MGIFFSFLFCWLIFGGAIDDDDDDVITYYFSVCGFNNTHTHTEKYQLINQSQIIERETETERKKSHLFENNFNWKITHTQEELRECGFMSFFSTFYQFSIYFEKKNFYFFSSQEFLYPSTCVCVCVCV